jgi:hypothetical protein
VPALLAVCLREMFEYFNTRECHSIAPFGRKPQQFKI